MRLFFNQSFKWLFVAIVMAFGATQAEANPVDVTAAKAAATQFMANKASQGKFMTSSVNLKLTYTELSNIDKVTPAYYLFTNDDGNGWVFISADDRAKQVLGYGLSGTLHLDNIPCNMRYWLNEYRQQIEYLQQHPEIQPGPKMQAKSRQSIQPMMSSIWGQDYPYNLKCPTFLDEHGIYTNMPTGCVATAMAQIMYKYKWPESPCEPIPAYVTKTRQIQRPALQSTTFYWTSMYDDYTTQQASPQDVATLMQYCGQSVKMDYDKEISNANNFSIPNALVSYFGYDKSVEFLVRDSYQLSAWEDMIYDELINNRLVIYFGIDSKEGGHAFVIDGYDAADGKWHINWGWDGSHQDQYWALSALNPGKYHFNTNQKMIINVKPDSGGIGQLVVQNYSVHNNKYQYAKSDAITVSANFYSSISQEAGCVLEIVSLNSGEIVKSYSKDLFLFEPTEYTADFAFTLPSDFPNGLYEIRLAYKTSSDPDAAYHDAMKGDAIPNLEMLVDGNFVKLGYSDEYGNHISVNIDDMIWLIDGILMQVEGLSISDVSSLIDAALGQMHDDNKPTSGLVAYYPFNGNADDASGCGNHGTPSGSVSLTSGVNGDANGAYQFGGYDNPGHIRVPNSESLQFSDGCTFAGYIKFNSWISMDGWGYRVSSGGSQCFIAKSHDRHGISFLFSGNDEIIRFGVATYNNPWAIIGYEYPGYHLNQWIHFAITYGNGYARMYINGQSVSEIETTPNFSTMNSQDMYIGKFSDYWYPFNGVIDEVRVYNRPLSAQEVRSLLVQ